MPGRIGILLSGAGFERGTQFLELPFIYRQIERAGALPLCLIPTDLVPAAGRGRPAPRRDLFEECAPITRGEVVSVDDSAPKDLDCLIIPGGRGPITVLSDIAESGADARLVRSVQDLIIGMHVRKRPIGSLGYGGALIVVALRRSLNEPILTIGEDAALTSTLFPMGIAPVNVGPQDVILDRENRILSSVGIGLESSIAKSADGIERMTSALLEFRAKKPR